MVTIEENDIYTQIVWFDVEPEQQKVLITALVSEVERWICKRPGFVSSTFHASHDGRHAVNYAQWNDEASFKAFTQDPETERLQSAIRNVDAALKPRAVHCKVVRSIDRSC